MNKETYAPGTRSNHNPVLDAVRTNVGPAGKTGQAGCLATMQKRDIGHALLKGTTGALVILPVDARERTRQWLEVLGNQRPMPVVRVIECLVMAGMTPGDVLTRQRRSCQQLRALLSEHAQAHTDAVLLACQAHQAQSRS